MRIGYAGLGIMGSAMAANLLKAGFAVSVWNRTKSKCEPLEKLGATVAGTPANLARECDLVCINVTDTPDVEAILFGKHGIASGAKLRNREGEAPAEPMRKGDRARPGRASAGSAGASTSPRKSARSGLIVVDHSTISPDATRDFAKRLKKQGVSLVDAPVSGGDVGARNATLSIMAGGDAKAFDACKPVFEAMGKRIVHVGPSGAGQACKACNQVAVLATLAGVCEAVALAKKLKLDPKTMLDVVGAGAGASWQLSNLGPKVVAKDFAPGFMIDLALKDLGIVMNSAKRAKLKLPTTAVAQGYLKSVQKKKGGKQGTQAMSRAVS